MSSIKHERPPPEPPTGDQRVRNARQRITSLLSHGPTLPEATLHLVANVVHAMGDIIEEQQKVVKSGGTTDGAGPQVPMSDHLYDHLNDPPSSHKSWREK